MGSAREIEAQGSGTSHVKPRLWAQFLAVIGASMAVGGWAVGIGIGSLCVDQLSRGIGGFVLTEEQQVWIVSSNFLGTVVGSAVAGKLSKRFGARNTMLWCCVPTVAGFIVTAFAKCYNTLLIGRLIVGLFSGPAFVLHVFYISAVASPQYRGFLALLPDIVYMVYVILSLVLGVYFPWWWAAIISAALFALPTAVALLIAPSDPVYLLRTGRLSEAKEAARFFGLPLPDPEPNTSGEIAPRKSTWTLVKQPRHYRPLLLSAALLLGVAFCGYMAVLSYSLVFLRTLGSTLDATVVSVLLCVIRIVAVGLVSVLIDRLGRRVLLLFSAAGMTISYLGLAAYFYIPSLAPYTQMPLVMLILAISFFCMGVGPVPWCVIGEIVPARLSDAGGAALVLFYNITSLAGVQVFPGLLAALGIGGVFAAHAGVTGAILLLVAAAVPETRGLSLQQIEELFEDKEEGYTLVTALPISPAYSTFSSTRGG
ncbi:Facilitated trehalose transporter Tret1 [Amphibalanus amphitrite]|uniref:Facilitated trehalose transporter Tret1 n=2 Tax=Amphibalanus amphitrite TaxID=1232801 RepID=A0A6A4XAV9_AMPAM|nr:Facilitated trehalose transporter Tret1 [Amphibalanus amphitrite]